LKPWGIWLRAQGTGHRARINNARENFVFIAVSIRT